jgi:restriction system protein
MIKSDPTNVTAALEILFEEVETELDFLHERITKAVGDRDYDAIGPVAERAKQIETFKEKAISLRKEWEKLSVTSRGKENTRSDHTKHRSTQRLKRGERTPEKEFYIPILKALVELGGSAESNSVLARVGPSLKGILKKVDYDLLNARQDSQRWRITARFARHMLVQEELLRSDSSYGIWEITDAGREYLKEGSH